MSTMLIWALTGGAIGAAFGYFSRCGLGGCVLTANWKRGAWVGALLGLALSFTSGRPAPREVSESTANVKRITEVEFETEVLKSSQPVVVDFYADWCGPCRRLAPMLDRVAGKFQGQLKVVKVNVDHAQLVSERYKIQAIPAVKFFRSGQEVGGFVGLPSERDLERQLSELATGQTAQAVTAR